MMTNWIVDTSPIHPSKPFHSSNHVCPKVIVEEEVQEDIPPPLVMNDNLIVQFIFLDYSVEGILGDLLPLLEFYQEE